MSSGGTSKSACILDCEVVNREPVLSPQTDDAIDLTFRNRNTLVIPRAPVAELAGISSSMLKPISPTGDAISWRSSDVDVHVRGLAERAARGI